METGITARRAVTSMQLQELSPFLRKQKEILALLTRCSIRRGSPQDEASLAFYVQDLSIYSLEVIEPVLEKFGGEVPVEYKPLWPAVGVFTEMMRGRIRASRAPEPSSGERWAAHVDEFWKNPPAPLDAELQAKVDALNEKYELKRPKEISTGHTDLTCPGCGMVQAVPGTTRFWTSQQHREHADVLDELAVIAERNRTMPRLPLGDVVEEVTA